MPKQPTIFISHIMQDEQHSVFRRFLNDLRMDRRAKVLDSSKGMGLGDKLIASIRKAISNADIVLYIIPDPRTRHHFTEYALEEAYKDQLKKQRAKIIPILIDDRPIPSMLRSVDYVALNRNYETGIERILDIIFASVQSPIASFDFGNNAEKEPIIEVSTIITDKLIRHFAKHPEDMRTMNRRQFEELVAELFSGFGYNVELTQKTRDGGRDVIAIAKREVQVKYLIECKRPDPGGYVGVRPVRELYGVKCDEQATKAIMATTVHFSRDALLFFENHRWELEARDYEGLIKWLNAYMVSL